jgi:hypothetical protein
MPSGQVTDAGLLPSSISGSGRGLGVEVSHQLVGNLLPPCSRSGRVTGSLLGRKAMSTSYRSEPGRRDSAVAWPGHLVVPLRGGKPVPYPFPRPR